jgi:hypothetical protein
LAVERELLNREPCPIPTGAPSDEIAQCQHFLIRFVAVRIQERCGFLPEVSLGVVTQSARKYKVLWVQALGWESGFGFDMLDVPEVDVRDF